MPLYTYIVEGTNEEFEKLFKYPPPDKLIHPNGTVALRAGVELTARMSTSWTVEGVTSIGGIHGHWDSGLGQRVYSEKQRDKLLDSRGFIRESELPKHFIADKAEAALAVQKKQQERADELWGLMTQHKCDKDSTTTTEALEKVWDEFAPAKDVWQNPEKYNY